FRRLQALLTSSIKGFGSMAKSGRMARLLTKVVRYPARERNTPLSLEGLNLRQRQLHYIINNALPRIFRKTKMCLGSAGHRSSPETRCDALKALWLSIDLHRQEYSHADRYPEPGSSATTASLNGLTLGVLYGQKSSRS